MRQIGRMGRGGYTGLRSAIVTTMMVLISMIADAAAALPETASGQAPADSKTVPPIVTILSPQDGALISSTELLVSVIVRVPVGSQLLGLRALIDGRLAARMRGVTLVPAPAQDKSLQATHTITVPVLARDCVLSILAETSPTSSQPAVIRLRGPGASSSPSSIAAFQPKLYVLAIGVSEYQRPDLQLRFAAKDARDLLTTMKAQNKIFYSSVEAKLLTNEHATKNNILDGLEWLQKQTTAKDLAVLFLAGHGVTDPSTGGYYFLPYDADPAAIKRTMLPESEIRDTLAAIAGKVLLFLDSCHSGKVYSGIQTRGPGDLAAFIRELASAESGVVVFAASTGRQSSQESVAWNNGAFTKALIEGLNGRADYQKTGRITLNMLDLYISERVKQLTDGRQTPTTAKPATIADFPIAIAREIRDDDVDLVR